MNPNQTNTEEFDDDAWYQDALLASKRVWSAAFAAITVLVSLPEVQSWLIGNLSQAFELTPVATAALAASLAAWSKRADRRPKKALSAPRRGD